MRRLVPFVSLVSLLGLTLTIPLVAQKKLTTSEAKEHFGETATVCGEVASTRYADSTKGQPTFLNLDKPYPNQIFTIVIWGDNRSKFGVNRGLPRNPPEWSPVTCVFCLPKICGWVCPQRTESVENQAEGNG